MTVMQMQWAKVVSRDMNDSVMTAFEEREKVGKLITICAKLAGYLMGVVSHILR